jgi:hypothetical protein
MFGRAPNTDRTVKTSGQRLPEGADVCVWEGGEG